MKLLINKIRCVVFEFMAYMKIFLKVNIMTCHNKKIIELNQMMKL
jgi:hypothetical protein